MKIIICLTAFALVTAELPPSKGYLPPSTSARNNKYHKIEDNDGPELFDARTLETSEVYGPLQPENANIKNETNSRTFENNLGYSETTLHHHANGSPEHETHREEGYDKNSGNVYPRNSSEGANTVNYEIDERSKQQISENAEEFSRSGYDNNANNLGGNGYHGNGNNDALGYKESYGGH